MHSSDVGSVQPTMNSEGPDSSGVNAYAVSNGASHGAVRPSPVASRGCGPHLPLRILSPRAACRCIAMF